MKKIVFGCVLSVLLYACGGGAAGTISNGSDGPGDAGLIDETFEVGSGFDDFVRCLAVQPDGRILLGGYFSTYNGVSASGIIRLNADGSVDETFGVGSGFSYPGSSRGDVTSIAVLPSGAILVAGHFNTYNGTECGILVRLNSDGSLDSSFTPHELYPSTILSSFGPIIPLADGKILVVGGFEYYDGGDRFSGDKHLGIIRLNADGSRDSTFNPGAATTGINAVAVIEGGYLVGGSFSKFGSVNARGLVRLDANGVLDLSFESALSTGSIDGLLANEDGTFIAVGDFTVERSGEVLRRGLAQFNADGSLDDRFAAEGSLDNSGTDILRLPDGRLMLCGRFESFAGDDAGGVICMSADGVRDYSFATATNCLYENYTDHFITGSPTMMQITGDGNLLMCGLFNRYNDRECNYIVKLRLK